MDISGKTQVVGLFGYPVEHSLSPAMHNAAFKTLNLDYCYVTFLVQPDLLADAVRGVRAMGLRGVNVTVPHKEKVIPYLDEVSDEAKFIGAVNTIRNDNGRLTGFNTDGRGFMQSLAEASVDPKGKRVLIVGAGGASRAIGYYLCQEVAELFLFDVDTEKAGALRENLLAIRKNVVLAEKESMKDKTFIGSMDIVINATPLGLKQGDPIPVDTGLIESRQVVCDLIYKRTPLLREASEKGCKTVDGSGMLLWQGVFASETWTGVRPPVDVMREALMKGR